MDIPGDNRGIGLRVDGETRVSWAMAANGVPFLRRVEICNPGAAPLVGAWFEARLPGEATPLLHLALPTIPAGGVWVGEPVPASLPEALLRGATERRAVMVQLVVRGIPPATRPTSATLAVPTPAAAAPSEGSSAAGPAPTTADASSLGPASNRAEVSEGEAKAGMAIVGADEPPGAAGDGGRGALGPGPAGEATDLARVDLACEILAANEWDRTRLPELLAAFVTPAHPAVAALLPMVRDHLRDLTDDPTLDGYRSPDRQRRRQVAEAVYRTLAGLGLTYAVAPPSFETTGQKIRRPDDLLGHRLANCLEVSLLAAALFEGAGLHPVLAVFRSHVLPGVWLIDEWLPVTVTDDPDVPRKLVRCRDLLLFEGTAALQPTPPLFAQAVQLADRRLEMEEIVCLIDVRASRLARILPLPWEQPLGVVPIPGGMGPGAAARPAGEAGAAAEARTAGPAADRWLVEGGATVEGGPTADRGAGVEAVGAGAAAATGAGREPEPARLRAWKARLLDLSLRNRLLNYRPSRDRAIPLAIDDLPGLEDLMAAGHDLVLEPHVMASPDDPRAAALVEQAGGADQFRAECRRLLAQRRVLTALDEVELARRLRIVFRAARAELEETGASTLFLALGFLRWFESPSASEALLAPILLYPIEIVRPSLRGRFVMRWRDDEPRLNDTLLEKLRLSFGLDFSDLQTMPLDDSGIDLARVLGILRAVTARVPRFDVIDRAEISFFSFTKFLMWRDLDAHHADLAQHPLVRHLIDGTTNPEFATQDAIPADRLDQVFEPGRPPLVLDADASQLLAIEAARRGQTFVLQGPPGTGKSQTIANLIAACLADGKRVLFVAEKRAALEVVARRLQQAGLGDACLELHSNRANKREVAAELARVLALGPGPAEPPATALRQEVATARDEMNAVVALLHGPTPLGETHHATAAWLSAAPLPPRPEFELPDALAWDEVRRAAARARVGDLVVAAARFEPPARHPFGPCRINTWTPGEARAREEELVAAAAAARALQAVAGRAADLLALDWELRLGDLAAVVRLLELLAEGVPPGAAELLADSARVPAAIAGLDALLALSVERDARLDRLRQWFHDGVLGLDLPRLRSAFFTYREAFALWRWWNLRGPRAELAAFATRELPELPRLLEELDNGIRVQELTRAIAAAEAELVQRYGESIRGSLGDQRRPAVLVCFLRDWPAAVAALPADRVARAGALASSQVPVGSFSPGEALSEPASKQGSTPIGPRSSSVSPASPPPPPPVPPGGASATRPGDRLPLASGRSIPIPTPAVAAAVGRELQAARAACEKAWQRVVDGLRVCLEEAWPAGLAQVAPAALAARCDQWRASLGDLRDWARLGEARAQAEASGLADLVAGLWQGKWPLADLAAVFERGFRQNRYEQLCAREPRIARFSGQAYERLAERFRAGDRELIRRARRELAAALAARRPAAGTVLNEFSETGLVLREARKKRGVLPIRRLLEKIPRLLGRLKPCLLMSPLSIAQYLPPTADRFDLVVFDEASQIAVHDAIGAIARAPQVIIVGDSRQLPPTTFFATDLEAAEDGQGLPDSDQPLTHDLESILEEAAAANVPSLWLAWHYRSRDERLIAFSNHHYYENRLQTFPAPRRGDWRPDRAVPCPVVNGVAATGAGAGAADPPDVAAGEGVASGVALIKVAGVFERGRGRVNRAEAEAIAARVVAHLRDPRSRGLSIGVVTFNQPQQTLIEDLLEEARNRWPEIEPYFGERAPEPVFVKNLENVQGDERDVMLFSVTYAADATGYLPMNFGPLNREGGERRLNVAITRARRRLEVFTSLSPEQIDLGRTRAVGVRHLREFLRYAGGAWEELAVVRAGEAAPVAPLSPLVDQVAAALAADGWLVERSVGFSRYRLDLAVRDPATGATLLGIETDGPAFASAQTARDRERLRQEVLTGLGWRLHRLHVLDWLHDREGELRRLRNRLAAARAEPVPPPPPGANAELRPEAVVVEDDGPEAGNGTANGRAHPCSSAAPGAPAAAAAQSKGDETDGGARRSTPEPAGSETTAGPPSPPSPRPPPSPSSPPSADLDLPPYRAFPIEARGTPDQFGRPEQQAVLQDLLQRILAVEAPLHLDLLVRRMAACYGLKQPRQRARQVVEALVEREALAGRCRYADGFVWAAPSAPAGGSAAATSGRAAGAGTVAGDLPMPRGPALDGEGRNPEHIPVEEWAAVGLRVLQAAVGLPQTALCREMASRLGFRRVTARLQAFAEAGVGWLVRQGLAVVEGDRVALPPDGTVSARKERS